MNVDEAPTPTSGSRPWPSSRRAEFSRLRRERPITRITTSSGGQGWLVTRYDDIKAVLSDERLDATGSLFTPDSVGRSARQAVARAFTPRSLERMRRRIDHLAGELVDDLLTGGRPADVVKRFAGPFPMRVVVDLLGLPIDDSEQIRMWTDTVLGAPGEADVATAAGALYDYLGGAAGSGTTGLIGAMAELGLPGPHIAGIAMGLIVAGYVTTANAIAIGVIALTDRKLLPSLAGDEDRVNAAVEEILRFQSGQNGESMARVAVEDLTVCGRAVRAGDTVLVPLESANRDESRFADPARFDIGRSENPHLAFGHGIHRCPGAALARVELRVAVAMLAERVPDLALAVPRDELEQRTNCFGDDYAVGVPVTW